MLRTDRSGSGKPGDDGDAGADEYEIDTQRIAVTVDPAAEWRQMFAEAGRLMRDHFWVADMADVDWAAELERYRPLVDAVGSHDDLVDLLWELQGELGTSHAYVSGRWWRSRLGPSGVPRRRHRAEHRRGRDGEGWRVERVLPPETSAPAARSPLAAPGVDVREGDVLLEVNGRPIDPATGPAPLLVVAGRSARGAHRPHRSRPRRARRGAPGGGAAAALGGRAALPGLGGGSPRVRRRRAPTGGWATCTCPT